jgi:hypothetical protein
MLILEVITCVFAGIAAWPVVQKWLDGRKARRQVKRDTEVMGQPWRALQAALEEQRRKEGRA